MYGCMNNDNLVNNLMNHCRSPHNNPMNLVYVTTMTQTEANAIRIQKLALTYNNNPHFHHYIQLGCKLLSD